MNSQVLFLLQIVPTEGRHWNLISNYHQIQQLQKHFSNLSWPLIYLNLIAKQKAKNHFRAKRDKGMTSDFRNNWLKLTCVYLSDKTITERFKPMSAKKTTETGTMHVQVLTEQVVIPGWGPGMVQTVVRYYRKTISLAYLTQIIALIIQPPQHQALRVWNSCHTFNFLATLKALYFVILISFL